MTWPTPPRRRPGPAESGRSSLRRNSTGAFASITSHGVTTLLCGNATGTIPSSSGRAPRPPWGSMSTTKRP